MHCTLIVLRRLFCINLPMLFIFIFDRINHGTITTTMGVKRFKNLPPNLRHLTFQFVKRIYASFKENTANIFLIYCSNQANRVAFLFSINGQSYNNSLLNVFVCLYGVYRPTWNCFYRMETSSLPVKGCKFWPMLGTHGHSAAKVF